MSKELLITTISPDGKKTEDITLSYNDDGVPNINYPNGAAMTVAHTDETILGFDKSFDIKNYSFCFYRSQFRLIRYRIDECNSTNLWSVEEKSATKLIELMARM